MFAGHTEGVLFVISDHFFLRVRRDGKMVAPRKPVEKTIRETKHSDPEN